MPSNKVSDSGADVEQGTEKGELNSSTPPPSMFSANPDPDPSSPPDGGEKPPGEASVAVGEMEEEVDRSKPYAGMGKADLLRFSDTPFWNRFRLISILIFWGIWVALLATVVALTIVAPRCGDRPTPAWWQKSVIYQIYVRSFFDANDNGIGDLPGITAKMDYLKELKVNAILLSSIYESSAGPSLPDLGYEITNHTAIDPDYGTMANFETLLSAAHNNSIAVILDFVPNYTGLDHPWFLARGTAPDIDNPSWNFYVWAPCTATQPPNNWLSVYGDPTVPTPAWTEDTAPGGRGAGSCYLHQFLPTQPELNLRSSAVQDKLEEILLFWLEKGVDGFRVNNAAYLFESADLTNEPLLPGCTAAEGYKCYNHVHTKNQRETYDLLKRWRDLLDDYSAKHPADRPRVLLTDADVTLSDALRYYGVRGTDGAHLPVNYQLVDETLPSAGGGARLSDTLVRPWLDGMPFNTTAAWLTGDQDRPRLRSYVTDQYVSAMHMLKLTLPGSALVYFGDEIDMKNYTDVTTPIDPAGVIDPQFSRDPFRSPMHWGDGPDSNFTTAVGGPWRAVDPAYADYNVMVQNVTFNSTLWVFKNLTKLRNDSASLQYGEIHFVNVTSPDVIAYVREHEGFDRLLVVINFGTTAVNDVDLAARRSPISLPGSAEVVLNTHSDMASKKEVGDDVNLRKVQLNAGEGFIAKWAYKRP